MKLIIKTVLLALIISSLTNPAAAIRNGENAVGSELVVGLVAHDRSYQRGCSGAVIAPRVVFTAAHCLYRENSGELPKSGPLPASATFWVSDAGVEIPWGNKKLTKVIAQFRDERYQDSSMVPGNGHGPLYDFAVLILASPITTKSFDYVRLAELTELIKTQAPVLAIGYGTKSPTDVGGQAVDPRPTKTAAKLRSQNIIQGAASGKVQAENPGMVLQTILAKNVFMGGGDSGSPLWYQRGNQWVYLGAMCCSNGINAATLDSNPLWQDPFWSANSHGEYYAAAFFEPVIKTALDYLAITPEIKPDPIITPATKTIVCLKGVTKRKITGIKPKCPAGFKQKK